MSLRSLICKPFSCYHLISAYLSNHSLISRAHFYDDYKNSKMIAEHFLAYFIEMDRVLLRESQLVILLISAFPFSRLNATKHSRN